MSQLQRSCLWHSLAFAVALCAAAYPAANAKDSGSVKDTVQCPKDEDPKPAQITLKNAIRKSPQDPAIHVEIAKLYFQLEDVGLS
jgi:Tfp pilus assembly protein PilF